MRYKLAIFDFDGTLADSFPFFVSVFNDLAARHGFRQVAAHEAEELRGYAPRELMKRLGMPAWKLPIVAASFTALMRENIERIRLFGGVDAMLRQLAARGVRLAIVSSNAEENVRAVLGADNAALICHFECGASIFGKRARIRRVLRRTGIPSADTIYVGDQVTDLLAAGGEKVAFGAVTWGYGTAASLMLRDPVEVFLHVSDIARIA
jgi:phosphoglycolate phosphatase